MEFLINIFTNLILEKLRSHEALVTGRITVLAKICMNNQTQLCKEL